MLLTLLAVVSCELPPLYEVWEDFKSGELDITPSFVTLEKTKSITLTVTGGRAPYSYLNISGDGTLTFLNGHALYTAPNLGTDENRLILVTDAKGDQVEATVLVTTVSVPLLQISPTMTSILTGASATFTASGGKAPFEFSVLSGAGSINSTTGVYISGIATTAEISVSDASGQSAEAMVIVSAAAPPLVIDPPTLQIERLGNFTFTASGGTPPYKFYIASGIGGSVADDTGELTAPGSTGTLIVFVKDLNGLGDRMDAVVTVTLPALGLAIVPQSLTIAKFKSFQFHATGGSGSYEFKMVSGFGSITLSGLYTASGKVGTEKVRVTDTITGVRKKATIKVKKK